MQPFLDLLPIIIFFVAYKLYDIYVATAALMVAMTLQISIQWLIKRTVSKMLLVSGGLVLVFGGVTLALRDPIFLQWKPTIFYWAVGVALLISRVVGKQTLVQSVMGHAMELPAHAWHQLNYIWAAGSILLGGANLYVAYSFSENTWVNFKVYGLTGISFLILFGSMLMISKYLPEESEKTGS